MRYSPCLGGLKTTSSGARVNSQIELGQSRGQNLMSKEVLPILKSDPGDWRLQLRFLYLWSPHDYCGLTGSSVWHLPPVLQVSQASRDQCGMPLMSTWSAPLWSSTTSFWASSTSLAGRAGSAWRDHWAASYLGPCSPAACTSSEVRSTGRSETQWRDRDIAQGLLQAHRVRNVLQGHPSG